MICILKFSLWAIVNLTSSLEKLGAGTGSLGFSPTSSISFSFVVHWTFPLQGHQRLPSWQTQFFILFYLYVAYAIDHLIISETPSPWGFHSPAVRAWDLSIMTALIRSLPFSEAFRGSLFSVESSTHSASNIQDLSWSIWSKASFFSLEFYDLPGLLPQPALDLPYDVFKVDEVYLCFGKKNKGEIREDIK